MGEVTTFATAWMVQKFAVDLLSQSSGRIVDVNFAEHIRPTPVTCSCQLAKLSPDLLLRCPLLYTNIISHHDNAMPFEAQHIAQNGKILHVAQVP